MELYINPKTAGISVKDLGSSVVWYSNPQLSEGEVASAAMQSQIALEFSDASSHNSGMNSYEDAVESGQFYFQQMENGIRVVYEMGEKAKNYIIPQAISSETFRKKILSKLSQEDAETVEMRYNLYSLGSLGENEKEELLKKYPRIEEEDVYVLTENLPEFVLTKLEKIVSQTGYDIEDLKEDNKYHHLDEPETDKVFVVPLEYQLDGKNLIVHVPVEKITTPKDYTLTNLEVLRYFGAADTKAEGYMVVPDGVGAAIDLNNGKTDVKAYSRPVYGYNFTDDDRIKEPQIYLPIFGMKKGNSSFLASVEKGAASATVSAYVSGTVSSYNHIFTSYTIREGQKMSVPYANASEMYVYTEAAMSDDITLRLFFQSGDRASYVGMAEDYRQWLVNSNLLPKNDFTEKYTFALDVLGAVEYPDSLFGIPITRRKKLTTFSQAEQIYKALQDSGVNNISMRYLGWANDGLESGPMNRPKAINALGGNQDLKHLIDMVNSEKSNIYLDVDLQFAYSNSLFDCYSVLTDAPKTILGESWMRMRKKVSTNVDDSTIFANKPDLFVKYAEQINKQLNGFGNVGVSTAELGRTLYADYSRNNSTDRTKTAQLVSDAAAVLRQNDRKLMVEGANLYALTNASEVTDFPLYSSSAYCIDRDIPFYPIVLHGVMPYYGSALNMAEDVQQSFLRSLEYGAQLKYIWMYAENKELREVDTVYSTVCWKDTFESAIKYYIEAQKVLSKVSGSAITNHKSVAPDVFATSYENGIMVLVNYTESAFEFEGITVPAKGYAERRSIS